MYVDKLHVCIPDFWKVVWWLLFGTPGKQTDELGRLHDEQF
jgi:hypothetical protein